MVKAYFTFEKQQCLYYYKVSPTVSLLLEGLATKPTVIKWTIENSEF